MGVCNCSMFCCTLLYVHSSIAIILMGKRELIALLNLSSWCLVMVERLFLAVPRGCMQFVIVVFPDHTHLLFTNDSCEDNDKEALIIVAYNLTDNINSQAILRHNNIFNRYLPALLYLPSTTSFYASVSKGAASTTFTPLVCCSRGIRTHDLPLLKRTLYQLGNRGGEFTTGSEKFIN